MEIVKRDLFRLLRSGAFNKFETVESMSVFKWNKLIQLSIAQNVVSIVLIGIKNNQYDDKINIPKHVLDNLMQILNNDVDVEYASRLNNIVLRHLLKKIRNTEPHAIDSSMPTLEILNIIVSNITETLNNGISLRLIIDLGRYLRTQGDKVDFVKLDKWLARLHIKRMAQLLGSILIKVFDFEQDEIPFVSKIEPAAVRLIARAIDSSELSTTEEWNFRQNKSGFVTGNSKTLRRNLCSSVRYVSYAPIEAVSSLMVNFARSLSEIEE